MDRKKGAVVVFMVEMLEPFAFRLLPVLPERLESLVDSLLMTAVPAVI